MCIYSIHTSYCVAQQQPKKPGNLPVKKKATHKIPPVPGASKVTKLASGDHFVHRKIFVAAIWSKLCTGGRNRRFRVRKTCPKLMKIGLNGVPVARLGLILGEDGATLTRKLSKPLPPPFPAAWGSKIQKITEIEK